MRVDVADATDATAADDAGRDASASSSIDSMSLYRSTSSSSASSASVASAGAFRFASGRLGPSPPPAAPFDARIDADDADCKFDVVDVTGVADEVCDEVGEVCEVCGASPRRFAEAAASSLLSDASDARMAPEIRELERHDEVGREVALKLGRSDSAGRDLPKFTNRSCESSIPLRISALPDDELP